MGRRPTGRALAAFAALAVLVALAGAAGCGVVPGAAAAPSSARATTPASGSAVQALRRLPVAAPHPITGYTRAAFLPTGWEDPDHNGCDARRDALAAQAVAAVVRAGRHRCVLSAQVRDPYTGNVIPSTAAQIDHVVSLGNAWISGADRWPPNRREQFGNDPANLLAVTARLNEAKGDAAADRWLPPAGQCGYAARQINVKLRWGLSVTQTEALALAAVLQACPGQVLPA